MTLHTRHSSDSDSDSGIRILGLGGGVGASRLWRRITTWDEVNLSIVVNTGEDLWLHGLRVCPDIDTVLYALSGRQDDIRGWGVQDETWQCRDALRGLGDDPWFALGDRDLATHLFRTGRLRAGEGLAAVTATLVERLGIRANVLPMSDQEVTTVVETVDGRDLHYEEFLVREACIPAVRGVRYDGVDDAVPASGVIEAIESADVIIIGPSNPVASILPILLLPGVRGALARRRDRVVAVSPFVFAVPITDEGERRRALSRTTLMQALGLPPDHRGIMELYSAVAARLVIDPVDAAPNSHEGLVLETAPLLWHLGADDEPLRRLLQSPLVTAGAV